MKHADLHFNPQRTTTNLYIVLIAVSDLFSAILVMPLVGGVLVAVRLVFGDVVCQFHVFFPAACLWSMFLQLPCVWRPSTVTWGCANETNSTENGFPRRSLLLSLHLCGLLLPYMSLFRGLLVSSYISSFPGMLSVPLNTKAMLEKPFITPLSSFFSFWHRW